MSSRASSAKGRGTATSSFGVSRREGHDAAGFYSRFSAPVTSADETVQAMGREAVNRIICGDSRSMPEVPDASVGLVVTSPPYFAGKEYETGMAAGYVPASYLEYLTMLQDVFAESVRKLEPGGRIAINVANLGRKPYRSLSADVITILQDRLGLLLRGEIIWQKASGSTGSCAWGSFQRPSNPVLRDLSERVIVASKGRFNRALSPLERKAAGLPSVSSLSKDEFLEATTDVWQIPSESATRVGHPAPFPIALPQRLIHLYTYENDLVLDPFMGSGTTALAAMRTARRYMGYETDPSYVALCGERLAGEGGALAGTHVDPAPAPLVSVKEFAEQLLTEVGLTELRRDVTVGNGVEVCFRGVDRRGRPWLFELAGSFSTGGAAGLKRSEVLWKAIGKAAVLHELEPQISLVLLATGVPGASTSIGSALAAVSGPGKPIAAVVELISEGDRRRLRKLVGAS